MRRQPWRLAGTAGTARCDTAQGKYGSRSANVGCRAGRMPRTRCRRSSAACTGAARMPASPGNAARTCWPQKDVRRDGCGRARGFVCRGSRRYLCAQFSSSSRTLLNMRHTRAVLWLLQNGFHLLLLVHLVAATRPCRCAPAITPGVMNQVCRPHCIVNGGGEHSAHHVRGAGVTECLTPDRTAAARRREPPAVCGRRRSSCAPPRGTPSCKRPCDSAPCSGAARTPAACLAAGSVTPCSK